MNNIYTEEETKNATKYFFYPRLMMTRKIFAYLILLGDLRENIYKGNLYFIYFYYLKKCFSSM